MGVTVTIMILVGLLLISFAFNVLFYELLREEYKDSLEILPSDVVRDDESRQP